MEQPKQTPIEYWDSKTADAYRAAYYAERQRELAELAVSGQIEMEYKDED